MARVLICGSRDFDRIDDIKHVINNLNDDDVVIQGCARGADSIAEFLAMKRGLKVIGFPAQWTKYGRRAGPIRNQQMLDEGKPDKVYAFYSDKSKSKGTKNMVKLARKAGIPRRTSCVTSGALTPRVTERRCA